MEALLKRLGARVRALESVAMLTAWELAYNLTP